MPYDYLPTHFDGVSLTAAPFESVVFDPQQGPVRADPTEAVEATVIGYGQQGVRFQPQGTFWHLTVFLNATNEAELNTLMKTFDPAKGLAFLRVDDGTATPINYRVEVQVVGIERQAANVWQVRLRVPRPMLEANTLVTSAVSNVAADSAALAVTNSGNRRARPVIKFKHDTVKDTIVHDWKHSIRSVMVNRSPFALSNYPVNVAADDDGSQVLATNALIHDTGATAAVNMVGGVPASGAVTITFDTEVGTLDTPDGMIFIDSEQMYYTAKTATTLTVPAAGRGIGGTTAAAHADNAVITRSRMLKNGDDIAVWLDGKKLPDDQVWLADIDSASTKIWINISARGRITKTLAQAVTPAAPADGGDIQFDDDLSDLPESGVIAIGYHILTGMEAIAYRSRDLAARKIKVIERAAWGTAAFDWGKGTKVALAAHLIVIGYGKATAPSRPAGLDRRPAIQLSDSTNNQHRYGDTADDADTVFYDADRPNRSAMFTPDFEVPAADKNNAEPMQLSQSKALAEWKDATAPAAGKPLLGRLALSLPPGIEAAAGAITYDVLRSRYSRMRLLGRDEDGLEIELADHMRTLRGLIGGGGITEQLTAQTVTPASRLQQLIMNAVRSAVAGNSISTATIVSIGLDAAGEFSMAKFILDQDTEVHGFWLYLSGISTPVFTFSVYVLDNSGGSSPENGIVIWKADQGEFNATNLGLMQGIFYSHSSGNVIVQAGTYWLQLFMDTWTSGLLGIAASEAVRTKHTPTRVKTGASAAWDRKATIFSVVHPHGGPVQLEVAAIGESILVNFDKLILELDDASADPRTPMFAREPSGASPLFHTNGVLTNGANSKSLTFDAWLKPAVDFELDCAARSVTFVDGQHRISAPSALTSADEAEWFLLEPGVNNLTWTEENMNNFDLTVEHRGAKV